MMKANYTRLFVTLAICALSIGVPGNAFADHDTPPVELEDVAVFQELVKLATEPVMLEKTGKDGKYRDARVVLMKVTDGLEKDGLFVTSAHGAGLPAVEAEKWARHFLANHPVGDPFVRRGFRQIFSLLVMRTVVAPADTCGLHAGLGLPPERALLLAERVMKSYSYHPFEYRNDRLNVHLCELNKIIDVARRAGTLPPNDAIAFATGDWVKTCGREFLALYHSAVRSTSLGGYGYTPHRAFQYASTEAQRRFPSRRCR